MATEDDKVVGFNALIAEILNSFSSGREVITSLRQDEVTLDTKDGISLLSLKYHLLLSYLTSLSLVTARRALGHSLSSHSSPASTISIFDRNARGNGAGDLVDAMVEHRVILEKMKALETKMRYQINKLVRLAQEPDSKDIVDDPLAFRPNPQNLVGEQSDEEDSSGSSVEDEANKSEEKIYRPPRLARVPYIEQTKPRRKERASVPSALATLSQDPTRPMVESSSGLGSALNVASGRASYLKRLKEYEEENFSRLVMKKTDAKRRLRDEADLALGGGLIVSGSRTRRQAGSLEDDFGDILKSVERKGGRSEEGLIVDGYEELRKRGKKSSALERSRREHVGLPEGNGDGRKRTRFELESNLVNKKARR